MPRKRLHKNNANKNNANKKISLSENSYVQGHVLVQQLLTPVKRGDSHILTCVKMTGENMSTAVNTSVVDFDYEHPHVIAMLGQWIIDNESCVLTLRTFLPEISHVSNSGVSIPLKELRSWIFQNGQCMGLDEAEVFDAYCTDNATGEIIPPERAEIYKGTESFVVPSV